MSFIEAEHVSFTYDDGTLDRVPALRDMTLKIEEGEYVAVLGHNGSGKSTFAKLLNLILLPTEGKLSVAGHTVSEDMSEDDVFSVRRQEYKLSVRRTNKRHNLLISRNSVSSINH